MKTVVKQTLSSFIVMILLLTKPSVASVTATPAQPNIKILATQMDCDQAKNVCIAKGDAIAEKLNDSKVKILKADQITAHFAKEGGTGPVKVTRLEAEGNVIILIGDDIIIQGDRGNYLVGGEKAESEIAEVFDNVKITNGKNQLDGGYAKVHMKTGQYSIKEKGKRVQALIFTKDSSEVGKTHVN